MLHNHRHHHDRGPLRGLWHTHPHRHAPGRPAAAAELPTPGTLARRSDLAHAHAHRIPRRRQRAA